MTSSKNEDPLAPEKLPQEPTPKPRSVYFRPDLTRLPALTIWRRILRRLLCALARLLLETCTHYQLQGMDNFPKQGPALLVFNHLGDADVIMGMACYPFVVESLAKIDLCYEYPPLGWLIDAYGVIWVHRGRPDRRALRAALKGLAEGRIVAIAPEGRESLSGALEEGTGGASYLALKADVPILPVTYTGTENARIYGNLRRFRRTEVSMTVGPPFRLEGGTNWRQAVRAGTDTIMRALARQLPQEYRGVYQSEFGGTT